MGPEPTGASPPREDAAQLTARLRSSFDATLLPFVADRACALLDFPNHGNVGDSAIWLGELASLRRARASIGYICDWHTYDPRALASAVPEGPILLHGGGSLGDLWPTCQTLRERVMRDFPGRRIVQLPQTVWFASGRQREAFARVVDGHGGVVLLLRDAASVDRLQGLVPDVRLCPDAAFAIERAVIDRWRTQATNDAVWLLRTDHESRGYRAQVGLPHASLHDWRAVCEPMNQASRVLSRALAVLSRVDPRRAGLTAHTLVPASRALAERRLRHGMRLLGSRVVISDRLHGHILATLLGKPSVVLDNSYGKNWDFVRTWTGHVPGVATAEDVPAARAAAGRLLSRTG